MPRYPVYTTFTPEELMARLRELAPEGTPISLPTVRAPTDRSAPLPSLRFAVVYPDGQSGDCGYERRGSRWHVFQYRYSDGSAMPRQVWMQRLPNDGAVIEAKGRELAHACYREAILKERETYFRRASEPKDGSRKTNARLYSLSAKGAKAMAGKYAVCTRLGASLVAVGRAWDSLEEANAEWRQYREAANGSRALVVGCCNRLDRCWQVPKFNPLYAEWDPRPDFQKEEPGP